MKKLKKKPALSVPQQLLVNKANEHHHIVKMFNVYDSKAMAFAPQPSFYESTGLAIRAFEAGANKPGTGIYEHAEDFTLFETGTYNITTGEVITLESKISIGLAANFKKRPILAEQPALV